MQLSLGLDSNNPVIARYRGRAGSRRCAGIVIGKAVTTPVGMYVQHAEPREYIAITYLPHLSTSACIHVAYYHATLRASLPRVNDRS